jgi:hypothetical protein
MSARIAFLWALEARFAVSVLNHTALAGVPRRQRRVDIPDPACLPRPESGAPSSAPPVF